MLNFLELILEAKRREVCHNKKAISQDLMISRLAGNVSDTRNFRIIKRKDRLGLIAEIKRASPALGILRKDFDHISLAREYERAGCDAISVITDREYFQGDLGYIKEIKRCTCVPILRKDFIIDEYQIYESKMLGADAILLIAGALGENLAYCIHLADRLGLASLVEVHTEEEAIYAVKSGAEIIGINTRDLVTFKTDISVFTRVSRFIPENIILVCESGISTRDHAILVKKSGANAILVGKSLLESDNIKQKVEEIVI